MTVYVRDFDLDAQNVQVDKGVGGQIRPGIIERASKREQTDPKAQAKKLVDTMSKSLVDDLHKAGTRLRDSAPMIPHQHQERSSPVCLQKWTRAIACIALSLVLVPAALRWTFT